MEKAIKKVFKFYSSQQALLGKSPTFESIEKNLNSFTKGKFLKFCIDFVVKLTKSELVTIFNKAAGFAKEMTLKDFVIALEIVAGDRNLKDYCAEIGLDNWKNASKKCKTFSKQHALSLPKISIKSGTSSRNIKSNELTSPSSSASRKMLKDNSKADALKKKAISSAIALAPYKLQTNSYVSHEFSKKNRKNLQKMPKSILKFIYGEVDLNNVIVENNSDDEVLKKFGY